MNFDPTNENRCHGDFPPFWKSGILRLVDHFVVCTNFFWKSKGHIGTWNKNFFWAQKFLRDSIAGLGLFDSDVRQWSHPFMIPLHCLWDKSNNRTCSQFESDVTLFCFCCDIVHSHAHCGCCSIVCLRYQVVQIKQVYCKMSTKNVNNYK